ncbi:MAG: hypothetical protein M1422_01680 [Candidatus Thermoplasmatota archaeon]|nr:hypothetical protein [Candidatus Sysuiplasma jiujiangense]MCL4316968.1 hypothetical protein [Candidatus Thermoplasmatota archaeon]MCL5253851.1 hypothetical protein [Candidatus Thermoplasmatota archaeon]
MYEYINTTYQTDSTYHASMRGHALQVITTTQKSEYIQVNGTDVFDFILSSPFSILIGFNVTQIRNISTTVTVSTITGSGYFTTSRTDVNSTIVNGTEAFLGEINSEFEITALLANHAYTQKTVNSISTVNGQVTASFDLKEIAVNDSLVNRNGTLIYYQVSST